MNLLAKLLCFKCEENTKHEVKRTNEMDSQVVEFKQRCIECDFKRDSTRDCWNFKRLLRKAANWRRQQ